MFKVRAEWLTIKCLTRIIRTPREPSALCGENSAPVAQLDRVPGYEPGGREFESLRARQMKTTTLKGCGVVGKLSQLFYIGI